MELIGPEALDAALVSLDWELDDGQLRKVARRKDFADALAYVNAVGALAEAADHHPDVDIRWDTVTLHLMTHSRGGITDGSRPSPTAIGALGVTRRGSAGSGDRGAPRGGTTGRGRPSTVRSFASSVRRRSSHSLSRFSCPIGMNG